MSYVAQDVEKLHKQKISRRAILNGHGVFTGLGVPANMSADSSLGLGRMVV